jgi:hypothetical protein
MPSSLLPTGFQAVFLGSAATLEDLGVFAPLEQSSEEGSLFLARLDFLEFPSEEALIRLEAALQEAGVERWPGYENLVYTEASEPSVYLVWQKGMPWLPIIIGLVATAVLPPLMGSFLWLILPQDIKDLISEIINLGMMLLFLVIMMQLIKPLTAQNKPKKLKTEEKPSKLEETTP